MAEPDRRPKWSASARQDLRRIWRYYVQLASHDTANRILREISAAAERAAERPLPWRQRDDLAPGLRAVLVRPYILFYRQSVDAIEIVRVLHERQNISAMIEKGDTTD